MAGQLTYARLNEIRIEIEKKWGQQPPIWLTDLYAAAERCTCNAPDLSVLAASLGYNDGVYSHGGLCTCTSCEARYAAYLQQQGYVYQGREG